MPCPRSWLRRKPSDRLASPLTFSGALKGESVTVCWSLHSLGVESDSSVCWGSLSTLFAFCFLYFGDRPFIFNELLYRAFSEFYLFLSLMSITSTFLAFRWPWFTPTPSPSKYCPVELPSCNLVIFVFTILLSLAIFVFTVLLSCNLAIFVFTRL